MEKGRKEDFPEEVVHELNLQEHLSSKEDRTAKCVQVKVRPKVGLAMLRELQVWLQTI